MRYLFLTVVVFFFAASFQKSFTQIGKVRKHYDLNEIPQRLQKEFFDGPHMINGVGTFQFLDEQLKR